MPYWNPEIETMDPQSLRALQSERLVKLVRYVYDRSPFYKKRFDDHGVKPSDITSIEDLFKLPFTYKKDLRETYPTGMFCVKNTELLRFHASSGTTGKPTVVGYTKNDVDNWAESLARGLTSIGLGQEDIIQVSYGYGLFTGGLGLHYGSEKVGATTLPVSSGNTERQLSLMEDLGVTAICCTPSYFSYLIEAAEKEGRNLKETKLRAGIFGAEPWSESLRARIQERSGIKAYDVFGTSELSGPLFIECEAQEGMHVWGDMFIFEILDPETLQPAKEGEIGELVVTTLLKEALPLIRYRVGDLASVSSKVCKCGRTHPRLMRLKGRSDDMIIVRGINVFPGQVEYVLVKIPEVSPHFMIVIDRVGELDHMVVQVELNDDMASDKLDDFYKLKSKIEHELQAILNLSANVEFVGKGTIPRSEGKAKRVIDKRKF